MLSRNHPVAKHDFDQTGWQALVEACDEKSTEAFRDLFQREAERAQKTGDKKRESIFSLLMDATSPALRGQKADQPYVPLFESSSGRSAVPDDFNDAQLDQFAAILPETADPEMRARLADILWLRKRGHSYIEIAVEGYLQSSKRLDGDRWSPAFDRLQRAAQLAIIRGRDSDVFKKVEDYVNELLSQEAEGTRANFHLRLLCRPGDVAAR